MTLLKVLKIKFKLRWRIKGEKRYLMEMETIKIYVISAIIIHLEMLLQSIKNFASLKLWKISID